MTQSVRVMLKTTHNNLGIAHEDVGNDIWPPTDPVDVPLSSIVEDDRINDEKPRYIDSASHRVLTFVTGGIYRLPGYPDLIQALLAVAVLESLALLLDHLAPGCAPAHGLPGPPAHAPRLLLLYHGAACCVRRRLLAFRSALELPLHDEYYEAMVRGYANTLLQAEEMVSSLAQQIVRIHSSAANSTVWAPLDAMDWRSFRRPLKRARCASAAPRVWRCCLARLLHALAQLSSPSFASWVIAQVLQESLAAAALRYASLSPSPQLLPPYVADLLHITCTAFMFTQPLAVPSMDQLIMGPSGGPEGGKQEPGGSRDEQAEAKAGPAAAPTEECSSVQVPAQVVDAVAAACHALCTHAALLVCEPQQLQAALESPPLSVHSSSSSSKFRQANDSALPASSQSPALHQGAESSDGGVGGRPLTKSLKLSTSRPKLPPVGGSSSTISFAGTAHTTIPQPNNRLPSMNGAAGATLLSQPKAVLMSPFGNQPNGSDGKHAVSNGGTASASQAANSQIEEQLAETSHHRPSTLTEALLQIRTNPRPNEGAGPVAEGTEDFGNGSSATLTQQEQVGQRQQCQAGAPYSNLAGGNIGGSSGGYKGPPCWAWLPGVVQGQLREAVSKLLTPEQLVRGFSPLLHMDLSAEEPYTIRLACDVAGQAAAAKAAAAAAGEPAKTQSLKTQTSKGGGRSGKGVDGNGGSSMVLRSGESDAATNSGEDGHNKSSSRSLAGRSINASSSIAGNSSSGGSSLLASAAWSAMMTQLVSAASPKAALAALRHRCQLHPQVEGLPYSELELEERQQVQQLARRYLPGAS